MSDPMTNMGADDVLASIRRLVSETYDPQLRKQSQAKAPERFVLSPDLRVIDGSSTPFSPLVEDQETEDVFSASDDQAPLVLEPENATHIPAPKPEVAQEALPKDSSEISVDSEIALTDDFTSAQEILEDTSDVTDDVAAQAEPEQEVQPELAAQPKPESGNSIVADAVHAAQVLMQDVDSEEQDAEWSSAYDDTPNSQVADHAAGLSLEERIAELESAVETRSNDWDAGGYDDDDEDAPQVFPQALVNSTARVLNFRNADFDKLAEAAETKSQVERQEEVAADIEASEADAAETDAAVAQSASVEDVHVVAEAVEPEPKIIEPKGAPNPSSSVPPLKVVLDALDEDDDDDLALAGYEDDEVLDEEALRDMIAAVIREELQGALGERITSNVRRLVRREVQRALTLREFE